MDFNEKMNKIVEKAEKDSRETVDRFRRESDERMDKMHRYAEDLDNKSMKNFADWRDYLYKYYVIILAFVGGSGIFTSIQNIQSPVITWGIYLSLGGIFIGFLAINIYFYLERRWFQISNYTSSYGFGPTQEHPDVVDDPILASQLNISSKIKEFKVQMKDAKKNNDKKQIRHLKKLIRGHKSEKRLMKYLGQQFGSIEHFWVGAVVISFALTSIGVVMVFISILN